MNELINESPREIVAKIRWTIEFEYPILDSDDENIEFYLQEYHCQENLLSYLSDDSEDGLCRMCSIGEVKVLEIKR